MTQKQINRSGLEHFSHPVQLKYFCEIDHLENILLYLLLDLHSSRPLSWLAGIHFPVLIENGWRGVRCVCEGSQLLIRTPLLILVPGICSLPAAFVWKWKPLPHVCRYLFTEITKSWLEWLSGHRSLAILFSFECFAGIMLFCKISPVVTVNSGSSTRLSLATNRWKMMRWFTLGRWTVLLWNHLHVAGALLVGRSWSSQRLALKFPFFSTAVWPVWHGLHFVGCLLQRASKPLRQVYIMSHTHIHNFFCQSVK